jgi:uncharacterized protein YndB with AHSA1/START domain
MAKVNDNAAEYAKRGLVITRLINAPRELVYKVWTQPEHVKHWWGPNGFTTTIISMDVRVGGEKKFIMHGPDGTDYPNLNVYTEVIPNEKLVYKHGTGEENDTREFLTTVTFEEESGKTRVTIKMLFQTPSARNFVVEKYGAVEGGNQTLNRLDEYVQQMQKL